ncbi:hypothetical protein BCR43DRAFT_488294 [Syncephalastrum racemosum]|uniref:PH domain-containing protein n=1 Tax=Syncephalastrum racemosum TaxID=13706 RepID=A0A1X2HIJ2_SYNRA|nr:hypothetical protein BCR43DRAFT_488294 [Syncephalastrum racemosum]
MPSSEINNNKSALSRLTGRFTKNNKLPPALNASNSTPTTRKVQPDQEQQRPVSAMAENVPENDEAKATKRRSIIRPWKKVPRTNSISSINRDKQKATQPGTGFAAVAPTDDSDEDISHDPSNGNSSSNSSNPNRHSTAVAEAEDMAWSGAAVADNAHEKARGGVPPTPTLSTDLNQLLLDNGSTTTEYEGTYGNIKHRRSLVTCHRAQVIIDRYEAWGLVLREVAVWLEEVGKLVSQTSRGYYQRALPHVEWTDSRVPKNTSLSTMVSSLRFLTGQIAAAQQEMSEHFNTALRELTRLKKECKDRIEGLRESRSLMLEEFLRRADTTQKYMVLLRKHCDAAESGSNTSQMQPDHDPWLTNLRVLRCLKKEVDEENRLRLLMVPVQQAAFEFETRVIQVLRPAVQYCYDSYNPAFRKNGPAAREAVRWQRLIEDLEPSAEWAKFVSSQPPGELVPMDETTKNYLQIRYINKTHPMVLTLCRGTLGRRQGSMRRTYNDRFYVLTQYGYLHQFALNDKVSPEFSIYIPQTTIIPSSDISHLAEDHDDPGPYTFEIKRSASLLSRDKSYTFRANSRQEFLDWCRMLVQVATSRPGPEGRVQRSLSQQRPQGRGKSSSVQRTNTQRSSRHGNIVVKDGWKTQANDSSDNSKEEKHQLESEPRRQQQVEKEETNAQQQQQANFARSPEPVAAREPTGAQKQGELSDKTEKELLLTQALEHPPTTATAIAEGSGRPGGNFYEEGLALPPLQQQRQQQSIPSYAPQLNMSQQQQQQHQQQQHLAPAMQISKSDQSGSFKSFT